MEDAVATGQYVAQDDTDVVQDPCMYFAPFSSCIAWQLCSLAGCARDGIGASSLDSRYMHGLNASRHTVLAKDAGMCASKSAMPAHRHWRR